MPTEDNILLKLIIQGQSPEEIARLAASTQGQLNDRIKVYLDHLTELHRQAAQAQTAEEQKKTQQMIDSAEKQVETVQKVMRANEIAANRSSNAWRRTLEDMENIVVVAAGLKAGFEAVVGKAITLGDEIDKLTNVYGSLKGSIDEMRTATAGEVSDYDLIVTKNRAAQMELNLTDKQFGIVARAADNFADSLGTNTKEALDQLIEGLATGRERTLKAVGAIKDADEVYAKFAKSIGTTSDKLSDQGKRVAIVEEALRNLDKKNKESGDVVDDFSHRWEKLVAQTKNLTDALKIHLGEAIMYVIDGLGKIPDLLTLMNARLKDLVGNGNYDKASRDIAMRDQDAANQKALLDHYFDRGGDAGDTYKYQGDTSKLIKKPTQQQVDTARKQQEEFNRQFDKLLRSNKPVGGLGIGNSDYASEDDALFGLAGASIDYRDVETDDKISENIDKHDKALEEHQKSIIESARKHADELAKTLQEVADRNESVKSRTGGLMYALMFGKDGPSKAYEEMDAFGKATVDMAGMVSDAASKMAEAAGQSLAAWVSGAQGVKKSLRDSTNEILVNMSAQAYTRGLMEIAEGIASAAIHDYADAESHFAAAAAFAAVGTAAGLGARAIGHSAPAASASGISSSNSGSGYGGNVSSSRSSGSGGSDSPPLTINLTVLPGGEAEAGRQINKALDAYYSQTGKGVRAAA